MQIERKKARVTVHVSDKIDFKTKATVRDKEGHYITIKGTIPLQLCPCYSNKRI